MKFLAVFAAILAVGCASNTWTLEQLSYALSSPHTDPGMKPYIEAALNQMMDALWAGLQIDAVPVIVPGFNPAGMSLHELSQAIQDPSTDPALLPLLETALNEMMDSLFGGGVPVESAIVPAPSVELQIYSLHELSAALQNPNTHPALIPFLEHALNQMMDAAFSGEPMQFIIVAVPAGLEPVSPVEEIPIIPGLPPIPEHPIIVPEIPAVPETPATPASPLVQIIININQQQVLDAPVGPALIPVVDPVNVVD